MARFRQANSTQFIFNRFVQMACESVLASF